MSDNYSSPYAFDPTGSLPDNKIVDEQQILTEANGPDFRLLVPKMAPYFLSSLKVRLKNLNDEVSTLVEGLDYLPTHWFISASRACVSPIYGSILIMNSDLVGAISLEYQTVGGIWCLDTDKILLVLSDTMHNPRTTTWDEVIDKPIVFPVIDHEWNLSDMVGVSDVVTKLDEVRTTILNKQVTGLPAHILDHSNIHEVTAAQVGSYSKAEVDALIAQTISSLNATFNNKLATLKTELINLINSSI